MRQHISFQNVVTFVFAVALSTTSIAVQAQGVAGIVITNRQVLPGPTVIFGTPTNPIPIDLDPNGGPWHKNIGDPQSNAAGPSIVNMVENILNSGTEAWGDWHEHLLPAPFGLVPHTWTNVVSLSINGNPIGFTATGLGTQTLDLFNFSQPVMPGDIFRIHKQVSVAGSGTVSGAFLRIQEYPTPYNFVPEPTSLMLVTVGSMLIGSTRRFR